MGKPDVMETKLVNDEKEDTKKTNTNRSTEMTDMILTQREE